MNEMEHLRYPTGRFKSPKEYNDELREGFIDEIEETPFYLRQSVENLNEVQLNTPYREGGWTLEQVVHHLPDSHMNAYIRFKLGLTEKDPVIKTYREAEWAKLDDYITTPIETSLTLLESVHVRWIILIKSLSPDQFKRKLNHPEWGMVDIDWLLAQYAWHGKHHIAQINSLKQRMGW